jgi:hypothetical protein
VFLVNNLGFVVADFGHLLGLIQYISFRLNLELVHMLIHSWDFLRLFTWISEYARFWSLETFRVGEVGVIMAHLWLWVFYILLLVAEILTLSIFNITVIIIATKGRYVVFLCTFILSSFIGFVIWSGASRPWATLVVVAARSIVWWAFVPPYALLALTTRSSNATRISFRITTTTSTFLSTP